MPNGTYAMCRSTQLVGADAEGDESTGGGAKVLVTAARCRPRLQLAKCIYWAGLQDSCHGCSIGAARAGSRSQSPARGVTTCRRDCSTSETCRRSGLGISPDDGGDDVASGWSLV